MIRYKIKLKNTASTIGYFQPEPEGVNDIESGLELLKINPFDDFMRNHLLTLFQDLNKEDQLEVIKKAASIKDKHMDSFCCEAVLFSKHLSIENIIDDFNFNTHEISGKTSLIYLKSLSMEEQNLHRDFSIEVFKNINYHNFPEIDLPDFKPDEDKVKIKFSAADIVVNNPKEDNHHPDIFSHALESLEKAGLIPGTEMRHFTSLSPEGILRKWYMKTNIKTGPADFSFEGIQTSYGKGTDLQSARISCVMELCERISSFVSVEDLKVVNKKTDDEVFHGSLEEGEKKGFNMLDPNSMRLEVPYTNEKLYWINAKQAVAPGKYQDIKIPIQTSYLFVNMPEPGLFSSLDSTGLAAGDTKERAMLKGLFEAIERDCEYSFPFDLHSCFRLVSDDEKINEILDSCRAKGIDFFFQDISSELGVPVYKAFVYGSDNIIYKGCSGHLDGKKAILDALYEVPYPTLNNPPSRRISYDLEERKFEDLPDYSTGTMAGDLEFIEDLLTKNNIHPVFSEITRKDLDIPVYRIIVPGFEISGDFDQYYRISQRQFKRLKTIFKK